jgi:hypothetical protein
VMLISLERSLAKSLFLCFSSESTNKISVMSLFFVLMIHYRLRQV